MILPTLINKALEDNKVANDRAIAEYARHAKDAAKALADEITRRRTRRDGTVDPDMSIEDMFGAAGWHDLKDTHALKLIADGAKSSMALMETLGIPLTAPSDVAVRNSLAFLGGELDALKNNLGRSIQTHLLSASLVPVKQSTLRSYIQDAANTTVAKAKTVADTALAGLQRTVSLEAMKSLPGDKLLLYKGPNDSKNRHFCKVLEGKAVSPETMAKLRNKSGLPVSTYGGGFNCRHTWIPITSLIAKQRGIEILSLSEARRAIR